MHKKVPEEVLAHINRVSIPFKRESIYALTLFSTPTTLDSGTPNPNTNCAGLFLLKNWSENRLNPYEYSSKRDFCQKTRQNVGTV